MQFFFQVIIYVYFNEVFLKSIIKKVYFLIEVSTIHFKMLHITEYSNVKTFDSNMAAL